MLLVCDNHNSELKAHCYEYYFMLVFFISDEKLMSFHLKRSNTLPDVMGYFTSGIGNPIMNCLADQTKYDLEWKYYDFTADTLLKAILTNLENGRLVWPGSINKNEWIQKTRENPNWYMFNKDGLQDLAFGAIDGEDLLLNLASNYLKRKIQLIPIFKKGFKMFGKEFSNSKPYRLMCCQDAGGYNLFLSVL